MSPIQQFLRWLKDKTGHKSQAKVMQLRELPPIPDGYDVYGFSTNDDKVSHIYEEIIYDSPTINSKSKSKLITGAVQQLDFSSAKTVGPYLVVPIRKTDIARKSARHHLDLIADLKNGDARRTEYETLYSMIPEWAKQHLNVAGCRQGVVMKTPKSYSVDVPPCKEGNGFIPAGHCKQNSTDSRAFLLQCDVEELGDHQPNSQNMTKYRTLDLTLNRYEVPFFDSSYEDYEYFLIKTQNNLRIEQELQNYLNGSPCVLESVTNNSMFSVDQSNEDESQDVLVITKRERVAKTSSKRHGIPEPGVKSRTKRGANSERYQRAADALLDKMYTTCPAPHRSPDRPRPRHSDEFLPTESEDSNIEDRRQARLKHAIQMLEQQEEKTRSLNSEIESKFSCRVTDFQLGRCWSKSGKLPRVCTPHPKSGEGDF